MSLEQQIQKESERFQALFSRLSDIQRGKAEITEAQTHIMQDKIDTFDTVADREHKTLVDIKMYGVRHACQKIRGELEQRLDEQENTWLREF